MRKRGRTGLGLLRRKYEAEEPTGENVAERAAAAWSAAAMIELISYGLSVHCRSCAVRLCLHTV